MGLIDFILNLAGVLLWFGWRSIHFDPLRKSTPATLVGTLRRAEPRRLKGWTFLATLAVLLLLRALLYRQIGSAADWTPKLNLYFTVVPFPTEVFIATLLYSCLSFLRVLLVCYFWGLALAIINRGIADSDPLQKMLRIQLGPIARWPRILQMLIPMVLAVALWMALHPLLVHFGITNPVRSNKYLAEQGVLIGVALYLTLQYLLPPFLLLHLVASYVYLGSSPLWDFIAATGRNLLAPLRGVPLRFGRFDFTPVVGAVVILFLLHWLPDVIVGRIVDSDPHHRPPWPQ